MDRQKFLATTRDEFEYESPIYGRVVFKRCTGNQRALAKRRATEEDDKGKKLVNEEKFDAALFIACSVDPKMDPNDLDELMQNHDSGEIGKIAIMIVGGMACPKASKKSSEATPAS